MNEFGCDQNIVFIWLGWYHADISKPPEINNALCGGKLSQFTRLNAPCTDLTQGKETLPS